MKHNRIKYILLWILGLTLCWCCPSNTAQAMSATGRPYAAATTFSTGYDVPELHEPEYGDSNDTIIQKRQMVKDSIVSENFRQLNAIEAHADTTELYVMNDSISKENKDIQLPKKQFIPDPQRALWLSLVLPGAGQIYNRKYWKLPILYGGFLGCTYALLWNQQMYMDYSQAYLDIMDDDPNTNSYEDMLPPRYDITGQEERFKKIFKNKKDRFRRYRDLSAFCFVGVYLISVIDAYVDAQLSEFDITPDLSLRLEPAVIQQNGINASRNAYGVGCSINF